jgi:UDP-N-acetylmuramyl pentapeptide synthase
LHSECEYSLSLEWDERSLEKGDILFAITGSRFDGEKPVEARVAVEIDAEQQARAIIYLTQEVFHAICRA